MCKSGYLSVQNVLRAWLNQSILRTNLKSGVLLVSSLKANPKTTTVCKKPANLRLKLPAYLSVHAPLVVWRFCALIKGFSAIERQANIRGNL